VTDHPTPTASAEDSEAANRSRMMGNRLRSLRSERGMTIAELASRAGLSSGLISQIERGNSNPSLNTLEKLREALGTNIWELTERGSSEVGESPYVRRAADRPKITIGTNGYTKELLSPRPSNEMRFMILTLPQGASNPSVLLGPGDKGGYVMEGRVRLTIGDEVIVLTPGDSFQFPSTLHHEVENDSEETARVLWIISIRDAHM
jgi:transcriptional regulator with XRE-family HTH domain